MNPKENVKVIKKNKSQGSEPDIIQSKCEFIGSEECWLFNLVPRFSTSEERLPYAQISAI